MHLQEASTAPCRCPDLKADDDTVLESMKVRVPLTQFKGVLGCKEEAAVTASKMRDLFLSGGLHEQWLPKIEETEEPVEDTENDIDGDPEQDPEMDTKAGTEEDSDEETTSSEVTTDQQILAMLWGDGGSTGKQASSTIAQVTDVSCFVDAAGSMRHLGQSLHCGKNDKARQKSNGWST